MKAIPLKQFTENLQRHGAGAVNGDSPMRVCDGEREFVVLSVDAVDDEDLSAELETWRIENDPVIMRQLKRAEKNYAEGRVIYLSKEETDAFLGA